jgi:2-polyprenyl-3-methyl-5-hydroxy-6-metoxy-1,4-benzoquinol methylase
MSSPLDLIPAEQVELRRLVAATLDAWPEHERFLARRFADANHLSHANELADAVLRLQPAEGLPQLCADYRWMCTIFLEEELSFRRTGRYRMTSYAEAVEQVYDNREYMARYMNGLLMSQVLWTNHVGVSSWFVDVFLAENAPGYRHLEVGPGHGLLLWLAARSPACAEVTAWDISDASLLATRECLDRLGVERAVALQKANVLDAPPDGTEPFDSVVVSEVLEHLEDPIAALRSVCSVLDRDRGRLFVNMPVNAPAPDHIYLVHQPEEVVALVEDAGLTVEQMHVFPATGYTEAQARKQQLTMSVAMVATL